MTPAQVLAVDEVRLSRLLDHHYGDGQVYLTQSDDKSILRVAERLGLVNAEGYLTRYGRQWWAQHTCH